MAITVNNALAAYQAASKVGGSGNTQPSGKPGNAVDTFASLVKDAVKETVEVNKYNEEMTKQAIKGEADLRDVVLAVSNAEHALNTAVAVRDKVVSAYQEILKMPI